MCTSAVGGCAESRIYPRVQLRELVEPEVFCDTTAARRAKVPASRRVTKDRDELARQGNGIAWRHQQAGAAVGHDLAEAIHVGGDHGLAHGHCLDRGETK